MKIIGITGGIGSGKSYVLDILKDMSGIYTVEADKIAHMLFMPGKVVNRRIIECFGKEVEGENGEINRNALKDIVMNSEEDLKKLNLVVHPEVKKYIIRDIEDKEASGYSLYVLEAALLIQDGYKEICDEMWYIYTDKELRIKRLMISRGYDRKTALDFMRNQPDDEFFIHNSDIVINNCGTFEELKKQVSDRVKKLV